ncbi:MAG: OmpA family protein [Myxococcales bacterium]|nr:OmpA family protein [Myxococcales bacterium]MCB9712413.1 OmpA family protein [Myxococcales bacterium]
MSSASISALLTLLALAEPPPSSPARQAEPEASPRPWIERHPPRRGTVELGAFGGAWFPSRRLELFEADDSLSGYGYQRLKVASPEGGLRVGAYPLRFFGVELEGAVMPTRIRSSDVRATAWALRGNVVGQLGRWSVTPFVLVGVGVLGMASVGTPVGLGRDQDFDLHFGGGVKVFVTDRLQLRLDLRDVITNQAGIGDGLTHSPELLLGASWVLGRRRRPEPSPPPAPVAAVDDDRDDDTVLEPSDRCPDEPETFNDYEDDDGCPDEVPPELDEVVGVIEGIYFDNDQAVIRPESRPVLDRAVEVLRLHSGVRVRIVGHTSSSGGYLHNMELSRRRAAAVERYLVEHGIDAARLSTDGVGPTQPIDTNETVEGRARNRRIEFRVVGEVSSVAATHGAGPVVIDPDG